MESLFFNLSSYNSHFKRPISNRSPRKMSYKGSRYRSRSRSPRRRSRRTYSRSRSRSYSPRSKRDRRSSSHSPMSSRRRHLGSRENPQPCRCLGVFGLSVYTTEQELHHIFSKYGPVERVQVVIDAKVIECFYSLFFFSFVRIRLNFFSKEI